MKDTIQIKVSQDEANAFAQRMAAQGYVPVRETTRGSIDIHFTVDGKTSPDYSVTICDDVAYIGIRPQ